jgi:hypothetical protein
MSMSRPRSMTFAGLVTLVAALGAIWFGSPSSSIAQKRNSSSSACPRRVLTEGAEAKSDENPRADTAPVPMAPNELQLCRYYGFGSFGHQTRKTQARVGKLRTERVLRKGADVRSIAREFDALREFPKGPIRCPADEGARLYAIFSYGTEGEPSVPVEVSLSGCRGASNGRTKRAVFTTPALLTRLETLTRR